MSCLHYVNQQLHIEQVPLSTIATTFGTPCYVYSEAALQQHWQAFAQAFKTMPHRICYAVKANSNLTILKILAQFGCGFDIVSGGELARVLAAQGDARKVIFSGVGKKASEIEQAIAAGVHCINVESFAELERLQQLSAHRSTPINIALRINPNVDARTHSHIATGLGSNKFGIDYHAVPDIIQFLKSQPSLRLIGLATHIGSQITELGPLLSAFNCLLTLYHSLQTQGLALEHLNIGGGIGIVYRNEQPPTIAEYAAALQQALRHAKVDPRVELILEPGRALVGNAGVLLTTIEYIKSTPTKNFAIVDAGMNDFVRPALYDAWQTILPVTEHNGEVKAYDIAGPVCESADFLGKQRYLTIAAGDLLAIDTAGAYGFSMSSNYNSRPRPAEVLVSGDSMRLIRRRETLRELFAAECDIDEVSVAASS